MFIMKKLFALVMAILMVVTCFAACGTPTKVDSNDSGKDPTEAPKKKVITVGYTNYEPMNYENENGELVGFDTELAKKVFENLGYEVNFQLIEWSAKYTDLNAGTIDCVWNGFTCNTSDDDGIARADKVDFSYNYMENQQVVVVKKGSGIASAADLNGKTAGVETGSAGETYAEDFEGVTVTQCVDQTSALMELKSGTVDFAVLDFQLANSYCGKGDYADLEVVAGLESDLEYYAIGFKKGSDLTAKVNEQLEKLAEEGFIAELAKKYGVENTTITDFSDQKK